MPSTSDPAALNMLLGYARDPRGRLTKPRPDRAVLFTKWAAARAEANIAYDEWCADPGSSSYAAYRAAEDRADVAQDRLAAIR